MKFHAFAVTLAGALLSGLPASAQDTHAGHPSPQPSARAATPQRAPVERTYTWMGRTYTFREVLYPDLPSVEEVAQKVMEITEHNKREAAELMALAGAAQTQGWSNVATVYEHMARDHRQGADQTSAWLVSHGWTPPPTPIITIAANTDIHDSIHDQIERHTRLFEEARQRRQGEKSSTVRGLLLMDMATALNHISLLRQLDRDVELGRRNLSARLEAQLDPTLAQARTEEFLARIAEEDRALYQTARATEQAQAAPQPEVAEQPQVVIQERVVERVVEKPVIVERVVEKPVYIQRPAPAAATTTVRSRVAGARQMARPARRGVRRPAK